MRYLPIITFLAASVVALPAAAELDERSTNVCTKAPIKIATTILKALKANAFCSSYLNIKPVTKTVTSAKGSTTVYTSTSTQVIFQDVTTSRLFFETSDTTTTTGTTYVPVTDTRSTTITAVLSTSTTVSITTSITTAPTPTKTKTITSTIYSYYLPKNKRDVEEREIEERKIAIPPQLLKCKSAEISTACSCLGLPTPTTTTTVYTTKTAYAVASTNSVSTRTQTSDTTTVITNTINVIDVESTTIVVDQTSTIPSIAITTSVSTATSTVTPPATTTTTVVTTTVTTDPCDPINGTKWADEVYNFNGIFHTGYDEQKSIITFGQIPLSDCCRKCFQTPGCAVASTLIGGYGCYVLVNKIGPVQGASAVCPAGLDYIDVFTGPSKGLPVAMDGTLVPGPCYGTTSLSA